MNLLERWFSLSRLRLVVFDLDFTLWDCGGTWCDCLRPPFRRSDGRVRDATGREVHLYKDVHRILDACDQDGLLMALASRTEEPSWARELLALLQIDHRFAFSEIYPSSKLRHFDALLNQTEISFDSMLFFDDEMRNIREVSGLGVKSIHLKSGIHWGQFQQARNTFGASIP